MMSEEEIIKELEKYADFKDGSLKIWQISDTTETEKLREALERNIRIISKS